MLREGEGSTIFANTKPNSGVLRGREKGGGGGEEEEEEEAIGCKG